MIWSFVSCLGSIAPFGIIFLAYLVGNKFAIFLTRLVSIAFFIVAFFIYLGPEIENSSVTRTLEICFFTNGIIIIITTFIICIKDLKQNSDTSYLSTPNGVFAIMLATISIFLVLLAPFIATRHILLTVPLFLLISYPAVKLCSKEILRYAFGVTLFLGIVLGISDWKYANYYRVSAKNIMQKIPVTHDAWATGTGGWQWYTLRQGMKVYTVENSKVKQGDYLVIAKGLPYYRVNSDIQMALTGKIWGASSPLTNFYVSNGGMYHTDWGVPTWTLSKKSMDTIVVTQALSSQP